MSSASQRRPGLDQFIYYSTVHPLYLLLCRSSTGYCMVYRVLRLNYCLYLLHYFRGYCLNKYPINKCEQYTYLKVLNLDEFLTSFLLFIYLLSTWLTNFVEWVLKMSSEVFFVKMSASFSTDFTNSIMKVPLSMCCLTK